MAKAITARWHGDNYQARIFWENALNLLVRDSCVVEVCFEADGPKAFDDVVVKYDPPIARLAPERVTADYHQVKWHVETGGRFGYADFVEPHFIGAQSVSLLQRLQQARPTAPIGAQFTFVTTYRIKDGDPLAELVSGVDRSLLLDKLFDGTKTDRSRMGQVRALWREHLKLVDDDALRAVVTGLRIVDGHRSLEELRAHINDRARTVGVLTSGAADSDFRFDELARVLKSRQLNALTRDALRQFCKDEGILAETTPEPDPFLPIAIRSFSRLAADSVGTRPENTLWLTESFKQRYLRDGHDWQVDIRPKVEAFLRAVASRAPHLRFILDAHASIAFLAGAILDLKSGATVHLIQNGRVGTSVWRADDGTAVNASAFATASEKIGPGIEIAVALNVSQTATTQARAYCKAQLPQVGSLWAFDLPGGPGPQSVAGGAHAAQLAEQVALQLRAAKGHHPDTPVHIFAACPNSLLFFLGQHHQGIAPCIIYEFDYDRQGNKTYQPSFVID